jgi:hypothetical protein
MFLCTVEDAKMQWKSSKQPNKLLLLQPSEVTFLACFIGLVLYINLLGSNKLHSLDHLSIA